MKKCPYCAEDIQDEAIVCRYCGRELQAIATPQKAQPEKTEEPKKSNNASVTLVIALAVLVLLWAVISSGASSSSKPRQSDERSGAWYACTTFIQQQLDLSIYDAQKYTSSGVSSLGSGQFRVTVYYAKNSSTYQCEIEHSGSNWILLSLKEK